MSHVLRVQGFASFKSAMTMLDAYSRWLAEALHECDVELRDLLAICSACNRSLHRERDKQSISRAIVVELVNALKFRADLAASNYLTIVELILQDVSQITKKVVCSSCRVLQKPGESCVCRAASGAMRRCLNKSAAAVESLNRLCARICST